MEDCRDSFPESSTPIKAAVKGKAQVRSVLAGGDTVTEGDDDVVVTRVPLVTQSFELVSHDELAVERYSLQSCKTMKSTTECKKLYILRDGPQHGTPVRVVVSSVDEAVELRKWLIEQATRKPVDSIAYQKVGLSGEAPTTLSALKSEDALELAVVIEKPNDPTH